MSIARNNPKMTVIMLNYADNWFYASSFQSGDVGGRGFRVAHEVQQYQACGCNKIYYSQLVPGLQVVHAPRGYLKRLKFFHGRMLRPVTANYQNLEQAVLRNSKRYNLEVDQSLMRMDICRMLIPSEIYESFEIGCSPEVYQASLDCELSASAA